MWPYHNLSTQVRVQIVVVPVPVVVIVVVVVEVEVVAAKPAVPAPSRRYCRSRPNVLNRAARSTELICLPRAVTDSAIPQGRNGVTLSSRDTNVHGTQ